MASDFKFIVDSGRMFYVCAESRKEAVEAFCKEHGVGEEFVKKHCVVKNLGRVKY
jgi:hypothetical protein